MAFGSRLRHLRWPTALIGALTVLAVRAVAFATITVRATPGAEPAVVTRDDDGGPPMLRTENRPTALFIGDSYTMGPGSIPDYGYPCVAATNMGWQCALGVQPGTGYISGGDGHRLPRVVGSLDETSTSLAERFPRLRQINRADIVVLDGGRNDFQFGPIYLRNMFVLTVRKAIESWPNSRIVVIAPWFLYQPSVPVPDGDGITYGQYLEETLRTYPEFDGVTFIDPGGLGWFMDVDIAPLMAEDGLHPNVEGNKVIGDVLTAELIKRGFTGPAS